MSWEENLLPGMDSKDLPREGNPNEDRAKLSDLIDALLNEQFCIDEQVGEMTLDQITDVFERNKEALETEGTVGGSLSAASLTESFERSKEAFCALLMTFEMHGFQPGYDETLADIRHRTQLTRFVQRQTEPEFPEQMNSADPTGVTTSEPVTQITHAQEDQEEDKEDTLVGKPEAAWELSSPTEEALSLSYSTHDKVEKPKTQTRDSRRRPNPQDALPVSAPLAREYWQLSMFFHGLVGNEGFPLPEKHLIKLMGQSYCFSIEAECLEKLMPSLNAFWLSRESAIRSLLDTEHRRFDLNNALETGLRGIADRNPQWLLAGRLPRSAILNSLRYLLATHDLSKLKPALVDLGVMLLLFGQNGKIGEFPLNNLLRLTGISATELQEASFRLFRLHSLATRATGISTDFGHEHLNQIEQDLGPILTLLSKIRFEQWGDPIEESEAA